MAAMHLQLPVGFRFHPTDEELVIHYLCRKCDSQAFSVPFIAEVDLYKHDPWHLPGLALYGEKEWYFFSHREQKYPNGLRPNRSAGSGYWKAIGVDKQIGHQKPIGIKKALVFYIGKSPGGQKTNWIMHEYRLPDVDRLARNNISSCKLDDWVLCRIYNKKDAIKGKMTSKEDAVTPPPEASAMVHDDVMYLDPSDSIPGSSSGEKLSLSVEISPNISDYWENSDIDFSFLEYMDNAGDLIMPPEFAYTGEEELK